MATDALFYFFSGVALLSGIMVISSRNPVHSVLFLILAFCNVAGLLILMEAEFLAMIFIVVYVGAIAVLFLFVVMMLDIKISEVQDEILQYLPVGGLIGVIFFLEIFLVLEGDFVPLLSEKATYYMDWSSKVDAMTNVESLGQMLYTHYAFFFLVAGLILLVAMIGAIVLTMQTRVTLRRQHIFQQVSRDFENAVFLVRGRS